MLLSLSWPLVMLPRHRSTTEATNSLSTAPSSSLQFATAHQVQLGDGAISLLPRESW
jgi:hypothetical protein